jgi:N-acetylneuraminate synthase
MRTVKLGTHEVGTSRPVLIVAEIGINHNGSLELALRLMEAAAHARCHAVKFQKRTVDLIYSAEELARPRESPFGTTNGDLKRALELGYDEYVEIDRMSRRLGLLWFASCWDEEAVDFIDRFDPPCHKIASAGLTDVDLLRHCRRKGRPILASTGMSTVEQIDSAVHLLDKDALLLMHCTSAYPCRPEELNLRLIPWLAERYGVPVGYSGHEVGLSTSVAAVALGACIVERHITMDRAMWGSDQAASVEPQGFARLVKDINAVTSAMGDGVKRVYASEVPVMRKLRKAGIRP